MPRFLRFTDRDGRAWRVYEFSITAGRVTYFSPTFGQKTGAPIPRRFSCSWISPRLTDETQGRGSRILIFPSAAASATTPTRMPPIAT
jgi:hypothetical protein